MKRLLICIIMFSISLGLKAGELDSITLITPLSYERVGASGQTLKSKMKVGIGDLINVDVVAEVKNKIAPYRNDLKDYFPRPGELDAFVNKIVVEGKNSIIGNDLTDAKLIKYYDHLGNKLVGGFADKILETEGVKDPARRALWVNKLLVPFKGCIAKAKNSQYDANHCMDALTTSLVPSTGIGLVYELSRSNLNSALPENMRANFNIAQIVSYKDCMRKTAAAAKDVKTCAVSAMRGGVLKVTDLNLTKTISQSASSPLAAKGIKQSVWPLFGQCNDRVGSDKTSKVGLSDQFMNCIDDLVKSTGSLLVQDKLGNTAAIKANFSKADTTKLIAEKVQYFKECIDTQKKNNVRKDGMLDTDKCENAITNDVTYKVVVKNLAQTATSSFKSDPKASAELSKEGKQLLDQCWSNDQNSKAREGCLRKTILSFSRSIASLKLDQAIPNDLKNKQALTKASLTELASCLEEKLPPNISEADNLGAQTDFCSNKLTRNVAMQVARESVRSKAIENKVSSAEADKLVKAFVDQKFMTCLGTVPTDEKLDRCSGELKKNVSMSVAATQIRSNAQGKMSANETEVLVNQLVNQKFSTCVGAAPSDSKLDQCLTVLTKDATKAIVLSYEKKQIKEQLNADFTPSKLKPVEDAFIACVDKTYKPAEVSKALDECTKQFALGFARNLGEIKLTSLLKSVLGTQNYNDQKASIDDVLKKYNLCLDDLKKYSMEDGLLDKLSTCTDDLQRRGTNMVTSTVNSWMTTEEKDAATIMVKNEFANFIPCLGGLMPASPYSQRLQQNVDSVLKPVAVLLAQYIEYSPEDAKRSLDDIIKKLSTDLKDVATNPESRKELIETLYQNGTLDQFLKSMVRGQVKASLDQTPEAELPQELRTQLMKKENFDTIFASEEGQKIKEMVMEKILKPLLLEQASMSSPLMTAGMDVVKDRVIKMLVYSPNFGEQIIKSSVQSKINDMGGITRFFAKAIYGKSSLDWEKVRTSTEGKKAEAFIRDNVLLPKFKGETMAKDDEKKIMAEAEKLVTNAVKGYK